MYPIPQETPYIPLSFSFSCLNVWSEIQRGNVFDTSTCSPVASFLGIILSRITNRRAERMSIRTALATAIFMKNSAGIFFTVPCSRSPGFSPWWCIYTATLTARGSPHQLLSSFIFLSDISPYSRVQTHFPESQSIMRTPPVRIYAINMLRQIQDPLLTHIWYELDFYELEVTRYFHDKCNLVYKNGV